MEYVCGFFLVLYCTEIPKFSVFTFLSYWFDYVIKHKFLFIYLFKFPFCLGSHLAEHFCN